MAESQSSRSAAAADAPNVALSEEPASIGHGVQAGGETTAKKGSTRPAAASEREAVSGERVLAGRYQLLEKLGAGSMGTVYKAQDLKLGRIVAVKVLPERSMPDPEAVARFQREARALAKLSHPAIVQAYDEDQDAGRHFLVMEFVAGRNLATVLQDKGSLPPTRAADVAHQVALGLAHAHERGLVHRDLKPGNILLSPDGAVKILDLGLARFLQDQIGDATLTLEGSGIGTPDYMAPEQFTSARRVDPRADIYSLGCTLFHLIAGRVPFPTSSLAEKYAAHESKAPPPLEELCPDVPAGLALAVARMMAKRPEDRFQTASDAAEGLAPYVAGSSMSFSGLKATASWHGSQLGIKVAAKRRERRHWMKVAGAGLLAAAGIPLVVWQSGMLGGPVENVPDDPNVLTVSQDGRGKYRTIGEALAAARPGMTIRILDAATYSEKLVFSDRQKHAGVTIDAPQRATVQPSGLRAVGLTFKGVPDVTVRGLRLKCGGQVQTLVAVDGAAPGMRLDGLEFDAVGADDCEAIMFYGADHTDQDRPAIVERCTIRGGRLAISIQAHRSITREAAPCRRVIVRDNSIFQPSAGGIVGIGGLEDVQIVGNRISGPAGQAGIQLQSLAGARRILVANNSMLDCSPAFVLWDEKAQGEAIEVSGNLLLAPGAADMVFVRGGPRDDQPSGSGDTASLLGTWTFRSNWRETTAPAATAGTPWIPPAPSDVLQGTIPVLSRTPDSADFLRPAADSLLASQGAGGDLPEYVGAVPPPGVQAWDWQWTWDARANKLLTVSKDPAGGGRFRSIAEALARVQPGMTIRVLDDAVYDDPLVLDDPGRHAGVGLVAGGKATIELPEGGFCALKIQGVPGVAVKGFKFQDRQSAANSKLVSVEGNSPGVILEELDLTAAGFAVGVWVRTFDIAAGSPPVKILRCKILLGGTAPGIEAGHSGPGASHETAGLWIEGNEIGNCLKGIVLQGRLAEVLVAANVLSNCHLTGMEVLFPDAQSRRVLVANNTAVACGGGLRFLDWQTNQAPGRGEMRSNLLLDCQFFDAGYVLTSGDENKNQIGDSQVLYRAWQFADNARDLSGTTNVAVLPLAAGDRQVERSVVVSRTPGAEDFVRPKDGAVLARQGATAAAPPLPPYIGAIPPQGAAAWDWNTTWKALMEAPIPESP